MKSEDWLCKLEESDKISFTPEDETTYVTVTVDGKETKTVLGAHAVYRVELIH